MSETRQISYQATIGGCLCLLDVCPQLSLILICMLQAQPGPSPHALRSA